LRVAPEQRDELERMAASSGKPLSTLVREFVEKGIADAKELVTV
jgi:predicted DNA-binding protein